MDLIFDIFLVWNIIVFCIYAADKYKAIKSKKRISEKTLIFIALPFGIPGAVTAMLLLRHKIRKRKFISAIFACVIINISLFICINWWANIKVFPSYYTVSSEKIPKNFDGFKLALISDIHGTDNVEEIKKVLDKAKPDAICFVGDLVDEEIPASDEVLIKLMDNLEEYNHLFGVTGNHDLLWDDVESFYSDLQKEYGLTFLESQKAVITKGTESINIYGIQDPKSWMQDKADKTTLSNMNSMLEKFPVNEEEFNILLFHRANMIDLLRGKGFDLTLCGHMHGGQMYIPHIGGLVSPGYNLFPKYSANEYIFNNETYIVGRGLGNAVTVPRIMNPPDLPIIILKSI